MSMNASSAVSAPVRPHVSTLTARPPRLSVLGVTIAHTTMNEAVYMLGNIMARPYTRSTSVYFVNAHTLNVAFEDAGYRDVLAGADVVFGDGTGVRWGARALHGVRLKDNVNGTDLIPRLFAATADRGLRYYLLGSTPDGIERAANFAQKNFEGWQLAGYHHGYLDDADSRRVVQRINDARPHMLLVGMGNPKQESWIHRHQSALQVPLCIGVGGLFTYWSGDLERAPAWLRHLGHEWMHLLVRQPHKARRYLVGNPLFLWRLAQHKLAMSLQGRLDTAQRPG